jgi:serine/threonine protein kinase
LILDDYERVAERASILASIEHQHVMRQIETFVGTALINQVEVQDDEFDVLYTVAEWVPGRPLADAVAEAGTNAGLHWVNQIAQGVSCLHSHQSSSAPNGIVHRDIKPSNVRITP